MKLPKKTEEEQKLRNEAMKQGMLTAIKVPMCVAQIANGMWPYMTELAKVSNINCKSDLQVGARVLETGVWGAYYNVMINLQQIEDKEFADKIKGDINTAVTYATQKRDEVLSILEERK
ncbi:hypothetical protein EGW08_019746 [Elysia chlorotica]|uniref:Cyclodeaminase/cyclohydrolase domain-containing protein n=1 Tax=Elysia chlorotica TaxID=188477 RepID=A0A3S1AUH2_ELYCH|nr:hypothetical protein EGW08_019746 [Elysia chlorotica]